MEAERQLDVVADLLGKAAMGGFAGGSNNSVRGQMLNPFNVKRATSGSSSGSGAAIHEARPRPDSTPAVTFFWWTAGNTSDTLLTLVAEVSDAIGWRELANEMAENAVRRVQTVRNARLVRLGSRRL